MALAYFVPFGPARIGLLLKYFGSAQKAWGASTSELIKVGLKPKLVSDFDAHRRRFEKQNYLEALEKLGISFIVQGDEEYPGNLSELTNAPVVLYYKGCLEALNPPSVAIVGTRKMTSYGREVTERFVGELVNCGVAIVSGLALGIDAAAHRVAVEMGGTTIAVLPAGLDAIYPASNTQLARRIIDSGGLLLSEYPLGHPAFKTNFASRNRIVSGLSSAVVVIEGMEKSGTLLTASHAADQGRQVFAVPGQITAPTSGAPHFLIKNGASIAFSAKDVIDELDLQVKVDANKVSEIMPETEEEEKILTLLDSEPVHQDEIVRLSGLPSSAVSATLTSMELKGLVRADLGVYKKA